MLLNPGIEHLSIKSAGHPPVNKTMWERDKERYKIGLQNNKN